VIERDSSRTPPRDPVQSKSLRPQRASDSLPAQARLDRLGRNLRHLITLLEELQALGIAFVSLNEGIDATTPAGKLQMHILGAIADYAEREIMQSRSRWRPGVSRRASVGVLRIIPTLGEMRSARLVP
jgi:Enterobacteriaceae phage serine recombinase